VSGFVTFVTGGRALAGRLGEVREVVRAVGIEALSGARAPVTGLLVLRSTPVPVVDLRSEPYAGDTGDVLVLQTEDGVLGLAVDKVVAVLGPDELMPVTERTPVGMPSYVLEIRRGSDGEPVLVVSLPALAGLVSA
jgi:chemotaxis signal transduction protein